MIMCCLRKTFSHVEYASNHRPEKKLSRLAHARDPPNGCIEVASINGGLHARTKNSEDAWNVSGATR